MRTSIRLVLLIFAGLLSSCLDKVEDGPVSSYSVKINSIEVSVNDVIQESMPASLQVGDKVSVTVNAEDPNGLPLEYKFVLAHSCHGVEVLQDFSSSNKLESYITTDADVNSCNSLLIGIRNNDGINYDSVNLGDRQVNIPMPVSNGTIPPSIISANVYVNGNLTTLNPVEVDVGDAIRIEVNATDPNSLPLEYKFVAHHNMSAETVQEFGASNVLTSYVVQPNDFGNSSYIHYGVRNNDGTDYRYEFIGDVDNVLEIKVRTSTVAPVLSSTTVLVNGITYINTGIVNVHLGDSVSVIANATDPNSLPLQYRFQISHNCHGDGVLQDFSPSNQLTNYIISTVDITSCSSIDIGIKNNDGMDHINSMFGDTWGSVGINVIP